jgi:MFS family permease
MGFSKSFIGMYMAAATISGAIFSLPIGIVSDNFGHKKICAAATGLMLISTLGEIYFLYPAFLLMISFVKGISSAAFMVVQNPFLMNNSSPEERIHVFSVNHAATTMASVLGSLFAAVVPAVLAFAFKSSSAFNMVEANSLRICLGVSTVFVLIALIPIFKIDEKALTVNIVPKKFNPREVIGDKNILALTFHRLLIGMGAGFTLPFFNVFLTDSFNATNEEVSMVTMGSRIVLTIATLSSPLLLKKMGRMRAIIITQILSLPTLIAITWSPSVAAVALLFWARTALMNMSTPISNAMAMELVPSNLRSTSSSMIHTADSIGRSAAQLAGGWIMDHISNIVPYYVTGVIYVIATVFFWVIFKDVDKDKTEEKLA